jgi:WD40 repeat protein
MNEHENHHFEAPPSLMPTLLARLGLTGSEQAPVTSLAGLKTALNSPEWTVRIDAVQKLEHVKDPDAFRLLLTALHDEDGSVRACAIRVLGTRNDPLKYFALEQLETALHDSEWHVRETAIYALAELGDQTSLFVLRDVLNDTDDAVHAAAHAAIQHLQQVEHDTKIEEHLDTEQLLPSSQASLRTWSQNMRHFLQPHISPDAEKDVDQPEETSDGQAEHPSGTTEGKFGSRKRRTSQQTRRQHRLKSIMERVLAAVLILSLLAGWFALSHLSHSSNGSSVFSDVDAQPLGKPVAMLQSNFGGSEDWSSDGHTFVYLHVNTQKHVLEASILDAATGRSTLYPVLDPSWIPTLDLYDPLVVIKGRYLLVLRAHGAGQATLEIWDIVGQRAIRTQTVPALVSTGGQVTLPQIVPSDSGQKFALYSPDGTVAIWDVASGLKLVTCAGKIPVAQPPFAFIKWYNHDLGLLLSPSTPSGSNRLEACNAMTGASLFSLNTPQKTFSRPAISPNSKYLALTISHSQKDSQTVPIIGYVPDTLEILDAFSGQVLHTYPLTISGSGIPLRWLPDSQRMLMEATIENGSGTPSSSSNPTLRVSTWNVFTNQITPITSSSSVGFDWPTADGRYIIMGGFDGRSLKIWQTDNGHLVATIATPGIPARPDAFSALGNKYLVIGQKGDFYIWSITTGKLLYSYHGSTPFSLYGQSGSIVSWSPDEKYLSMIAGKSPSIGEGSLAIWRMP